MTQVAPASSSCFAFEMKILVQAQPVAGRLAAARAHFPSFPFTTLSVALPSLAWAAQPRAFVSQADVERHA